MKTFYRDEHILFESNLLILPKQMQKTHVLRQQKPRQLLTAEMNPLPFLGLEIKWEVKFLHQTLETWSPAKQLVVIIILPKINKSFS